MNEEKAVGICPACGEAVFNSRETDGPVWTCPADLSPKNPYWEPALVEKTEEQREAEGFFGNCCEDTGDNGGQCYERMPLHAACYDKGNY